MGKQIKNTLETYYHSLNEWLLGVTSVNQGPPMASLYTSKTNHAPRMGKTLKIYLKLRIPYYHLLNECLLTVNSNQGQTITKLQTSEIIICPDYPIMDKTLSKCTLNFIKFSVIAH